MIMIDIKLTLPREKDINREASYMKQQSGLLYPLSNKPKKAGPGCRVYFILCGHLVSRANLIEFRYFSESDKMPILNYDGIDIWHKGWWVKCDGMEALEVPITSPGFQGFRYVADQEKEPFERAFPGA